MNGEMATEGRPSGATGVTARAADAAGETLARLRVNGLVSLQLLFVKYRKGLADASRRATDKELLVMRDLEERGLDAQGLRVMLGGGHVVIDDPELYERWVFPDSDQRLSSHHREMDKKQYPDYGMVGPFVRQSLHGRTPQGTWIQWERTATSFKLGQHLRWRDFVHIKDFIVYRITRKNVGPWGLSDTTDKHPLYLQPRVSVAQPLAPDVAEAFISALRSSTSLDERSWADPVHRLFAPRRLTRLTDAHLEPHGRRTGAFGGAPLAVRRGPYPRYPGGPAERRTSEAG